MSNNLVQFLNQYEFEYVVKTTGEKIKFKPITTGQIKNLLMYEGHEKAHVIEDVLDDMINGCVISENFDLDSLNIQDRFDLLLEIRKKSKGEVYTFIVKCPDCGHETINHINLDELEVKPYKPEIDNIIKLSDNLSVEMGYVTRGQQKQAFELVENIKGSDSQKLIEVSLFIYAFAMKKFRTPAGDVEDSSLADKKELLENLQSEAYEKFQAWFERSDYGSVFKYNLKCDHCEFTEEREIPVTDFFA